MAETHTWVIPRHLLFIDGEPTGPFLNWAAVNLSSQHNYGLAECSDYTKDWNLVLKSPHAEDIALCVLRWS